MKKNIKKETNPNKKKKIIMICSICLTIIFFLLITTLIIGSFLIMNNSPSADGRKEALVCSICGCIFTIPFGFLLSFAISEIKLYKKEKLIKKEA